MKLYIASDHAGFELKQKLAEYLRGRGRAVEDLGPATFNPTDDYPQLVVPLAKKVAKNKDSFGIIVGLSGEGEAMAANRVKGVRAAAYYGAVPEVLKLSRAHNDANILSLGARFLSFDEARGAVDLWLSTHFSEEERHVRRVKELG